MEFRGIHKRQLFIGKIQSRLQFGQQLQKFAAQLHQRPAQAAGQLGQRRVELLAIGGLDHAQHRFRLGQIDPPGEERPQRKLAGFREPGPVAAELGQRGISNSGGLPRVWNSASGSAV